MPKFTVSRVSKGEKIIISENEISNEQMEKVRANFAKMKADKKERMQKKFDEIPAINWEILKYANHHDKDECLLKYPEHEKFVNSITFNR